MTALRLRLPALLVAALLAAAAPGCSTDDAAKKDAKKAQKDADKAAGNADEKAKKDVRGRRGGRRRQLAGNGPAGEPRPRVERERTVGGELRPAALAHGRLLGLVERAQELPGGADREGERVPEVVEAACTRRAR